MLATTGDHSSHVASGNIENDSDADLSYNVIPRPPTPPLSSYKKLSSTPSSSKGISACNSPTVLNEFGICSACGDEDALDKCVTCLLCNQNFHAICKSDNGNFKNILCNNTFLGQYTKRSEKTDSFSGTFCFICDPCLTDHEQKQAASLKAHVQALERKVDSMESNLTEIKDLIVNQQNPVLEQVSASCPDKLPSTSGNPWCDGEGMKKVKSSIPIIVKMDSSGNTVSDTELEKIVTDNKIHVEQNYKNKSGENVLVVSSPEARNKLASKLKDSYPDHRVFQPPERLPTISVANIIDNIPPETLKNKILSMHEEIATLVSNSSTFEVLYIRAQRNGNRYQACIRVSNEIRKFIEHLGNRLYIGMYSCSVYDHFYVKRCNNCQKYHHYQDKCKAAKPACAKCAGNHKTSDCTNCHDNNFVPTCINCKHEKSSFAHTHEASSLECPTYQAAQDKLRKSIKFYNSKNI